jgi:hypothetical protein
VVVEPTIRDTESGVYALDSVSVAVTGNSYVNAGRNFVQFDKVTGSNDKIVGNTGKDVLGGSKAEDLISVFISRRAPQAARLRCEAIVSATGDPVGRGRGLWSGTKAALT